MENFGLHELSYNFIDNFAIFFFENHERHLIFVLNLHAEKMTQKCFSL